MTVEIMTWSGFTSIWSSRRSMISRADGGPWATTELVMLSATSRVRPTSRDSGAELMEGSPRELPPPLPPPPDLREEPPELMDPPKLVLPPMPEEESRPKPEDCWVARLVPVAPVWPPRAPPPEVPPPSPVPEKARVSASPAMGRNSETVRKRSLRRRKVFSLLGISNSRTRFSTKMRSTGRPIAKMRLVRGSGMIWTGTSSPPPAPGAPPAPGGRPPGGWALAGLVRCTPAVVWALCWAVSNSVRTVAISVTSAYWTGIQRVDWTEPGTSMVFCRSMRLLMREAFSVMTTAEALGTAAIEP